MSLLTRRVRQLASARHFHSLKDIRRLATSKANFRDILLPVWELLARTIKQVRCEAKERGKLGHFFHSHRISSSQPINQSI